MTVCQFNDDNNNNTYDNHMSRLGLGVVLQSYEFSDFINKELQGKSGIGLDN